jgi:dTDP-glucose 4,6-dehydratase
MGVAFEDVVDLADERPGKDAAYYLDSSKARQELEWSDRVSLEEGILETIEWVNSHIAELSRQPTEYVHKQ